MGVRIKGQSFIGFLATLNMIHGPEAHRQVMLRLPKELAQALSSGGVTAMGWYPIAWHSGLHAAAREVCGIGVSRQIGREAARRDLNTIYRFILRFMSPETLLAQSSKVFALFCDGGKCTVTLAKKGSARILYSDCPGASRGMWEQVIAGTEVMIEACGGRLVSSKALSGGDDGDASLLGLFTWTEG
jgi:hypothetical protein